MYKNISLLSLAVLAGMFMGVKADVKGLEEYSTQYNAATAAAAAAKASTTTSTASANTVVQQNTTTVAATSTTNAGTVAGATVLKTPCDLTIQKSPTFVMFRDHLNGWSKEALKSPLAKVWLLPVIKDYIDACKGQNGDLNQALTSKQFKKTPPADVVTAMETFSSALLAIAQDVAAGTGDWSSFAKADRKKIFNGGQGLTFVSNSYGSDIVTTLYYMKEQVPSSTTLLNNYNTADKLKVN